MFGNDTNQNKSKHSWVNLKRATSTFTTTPLWLGLEVQYRVPVYTRGGLVERELTVPRRVPPACEVAVCGICEGGGGGSDWSRMGRLGGGGVNCRVLNTYRSLSD
ncbi:hypothetical protein J6590_014429 [Homalodisca vitripennis]|nr:hypothetical protein J6590_014429 [Homalodisca vitripennis]